MVGLVVPLIHFLPHMQAQNSITSWLALEQADPDSLEGMQAKQQCLAGASRPRFA